MLRMPLGEVTVGMVLAAPVANPKQPEYDLLKTGYELTGSMLDRLRGLGIRSLWVAYPSLDFLDEFISPKITTEQQQVYQTLKKSFYSAQKRVVARVDFQEYRRTLSSLIGSIAAQRADTMMIEPLLSDDGNLFLHCSNVCYLSVMLGLKLGHYLVQQRVRLDPRHARDVMNLGLGALLHDLGKLQLPTELRELSPSPTETPPLEWQQHCEAGFEMIRSKIEPSATQVALHHHQRWDGRGFPPMEQSGQPLAGERIHVFSRIVAVANWFERELAQVNQQGLPGIVAFKQLRGPEFAGMFDPVVFRTFSDLVPPFPIGSVVGLSDESQAVVLIHNPADPCRPGVRRLPDNVQAGADPGTAFEGEDISLSLRDDLGIVTAEGVDVEAFLFSPYEGIGDIEAGREVSVGS